MSHDHCEGCGRPAPIVSLWHELAAHEWVLLTEANMGIKRAEVEAARHAFCSWTCASSWCAEQPPSPIHGDPAERGRRTTAIRCAGCQRKKCIADVTMPMPRWECRGWVSLIDHRTESRVHFDSWNCASTWAFQQGLLTHDVA